MVMSAKCKILFPDRRYLEIVSRALKPEVDKLTTMRSKTSLEKKGNSLVLKIEARDTVALRAALNSYLRWINSIMNALKVLESLS
ncbi:MAG: KEOPS complex subunit Pcc1 [Candidatus Bathyarchaeota archaeon]|nr:KEOPS complex subunit Pcc1 [Candidatus Bathyarchaeota archaeon]